MAEAAGEEKLVLEKHLNQATNPGVKDEDWEAIVGFCNQVNKELEGPQIAVRLIAHKIQSPQEREAMKALLTLDTCVKNCGSRFHQELGKFRFLNEIIKVVSPKYLGSYTTETVKARCIELMFGWTKGLPHETKILEAYTMLKKQGIVKEDPVVKDVIEPPPPPREKDTIFDDDEKAKALARLLKSRNPEDLQAANRLIKNMVKQDQERTEKRSRRQQELETVSNNVKLLNEMLGCYSSTGSSESDKEILKELYDSLEKKRPSLFRLASDTDEKEDNALADILRTNDAVVRVMSLYRKVVEGISEENGALADLPGGVAGAGSSGQVAGRQASGKSDADELSEIFGSVSASSAAKSSPFGGQSGAGGDLGLLDFGLSSQASSQSPASSAFRTQPLDNSDIVGLFRSAGSAPVNSILTPSKPAESSKSEATNNEEKSGMTALDHLSESLLKKSLGDKKPVNTFIPPQKVPLNQLIQQMNNPPPAPAARLPMPDLDLDLLSKDSSPAPPPAKNRSPPPAKDPSPPPKYQPLILPTTTSHGPSPDISLLDNDPTSVTTNSNLADTSLLDLQAPPVQAPVQAPASTPANSSKASMDKPAAATTTVEVQPLVDISVALEEVQPSSDAPLTVYEQNQLRFMLHKSKNKPRDDVTVLLVSTISFNKDPITYITFQASAPKCMRIKLQSASTNNLPAFNPILPPSSRSQVMLIANPNKEKIKLKFKISYSIENQDFSDEGELEDIDSS